MDQWTRWFWKCGRMECKLFNARAKIGSTSRISNAFSRETLQSQIKIKVWSPWIRCRKIPNLVFQDVLVKCVWASVWAWVPHDFWHLRLHSTSRAIRSPLVLSTLRRVQRRLLLRSPKLCRVIDRPFERQQDAGRVAALSWSSNDPLGFWNNNVGNGLRTFSNSAIL